MRTLLFLAITLCAATATAVCPVTTIDGVEHRLCDVVFDGAVSIPGGVADPSAVNKTTAGVTYYVRTGGSDSNDCLTTGTACLTPQAAADKLPEYIDHPMVIDIGAGTFAGIAIHEKVISSASTSNNITVQGAMAASTLATGTNSGTATGGSTVQLIDTGQTWTINDLKGRFVKSESIYYLVQTNTATTIDIVGINWYNFSGDAYTIEEPDTILSEVSASAVDIRNINKAGYYSVTVKQVELRSTNGNALYAYDVADFYLNVVKINTPGIRGIHFASGGTFYGTEVDLYDPAYVGMLFSGNNTVSCNSCAVRSGGDGSDAAVWYISNEHVSGDRIFVDTFAGYGVAVVDCGVYEPHKYTINSVTKDGVLIHNTVMTKGGYSDSNNFTGSGNTLYGVRVGPFSAFVFEGGAATDIVGTSGEITTDDGSTSLVWATDFSSDGDEVVNTTDFNRAERDD